MSEQNTPGAIGNRGNEQVANNAAKQNQTPEGAYRIAGREVSEQEYMNWVKGKNAGK